MRANDTHEMASEDGDKQNRHSDHLGGDQCVDGSVCHE